MARVCGTRGFQRTSVQAAGTGCSFGGTPEGHRQGHVGQCQILIGGEPVSKVDLFWGLDIAQYCATRSGATSRQTWMPRDRSHDRTYTGWQYGWDRQHMVTTSEPPLTKRGGPSEQPTSSTWPGSSAPDSCEPPWPVSPQPGASGSVEECSARKVRHPLMVLFFLRAARFGSDNHKSQSCGAYLCFFRSCRFFYCHCKLGFGVVGDLLSQLACTSLLLQYVQVRHASSSRVWLFYPYRRHVSYVYSAWYGHSNR